MAQFDFGGLQVRTVMCKGTPLFVLADVCWVLEIVSVGEVIPLFFRALYALAIDDAGGRTYLALQLFAALCVERVTGAVDHAMIGPKSK